MLGQQHRRRVRCSSAFATSFCTAPIASAAKPSDMAAIMRVNRQVNDAILPDPLATDAEKRAENGNWRVVMPGGVGGCVEYVQSKRFLLAWAGIPTGAMRMAQVRTKDGELHAVLLVRVGGQTVVLDNLTRSFGRLIWRSSMCESPCRTDGSTTPQTGSQE
jgi:predicted transglutaminase-like cysteine proteinase